MLPRQILAEQAHFRAQLLVEDQVSLCERIRHQLEPECDEATANEDGPRIVVNRIAIVVAIVVAIQRSLLLMMLHVLLLHLLSEMLDAHQQHRPHRGRAREQFDKGGRVEAACGVGEPAREVEELDGDGEAQVEQGLVVEDAHALRR